MTMRFAVLGVLFACAGAGEPDKAAETGTTPAPTGAAQTGDTAGPSGDTGSTTGPLPGGRLVVPDALGVTFLGLDGTISDSKTWSQLAGECTSCGGEGGSADGDGLLFAFTTGGGGPGGGGAIVRVDAHGVMDFRVDGFGFPHDVIRDPFDDSLMVVATSENALRWIPGDGSTNDPLRSLTSSDPDFPSTPNGAERLDIGGRSYLLVSHRPNQGRITMWDITEGTPTFLWRFPATGSVSIPHCPILREIGGEWWLLWAHTAGIGNGRGTVGLAVTSDPEVAPTYVADLEPDADIAPFRFLRGVELLDDDATLVVTDSGGGGPQGATSGRVFRAMFPDLEPGGQSGSVGDRLYVPLGPTVLLEDGLRQPFEAWYWDR